MKICVVGSGYVGLVTGACFAEFGFNVACIDRDDAKIQALNSGKVPIYEPGLETLIQQGAAQGRLTFSTHLQPAVAAADVVIIAVGTPTREGDNHADLTYVHQAAASIADAINGYTVVVTKSTVPVGTARKVAAVIKDRRPELIRGQDFDVASNPEFLREGSAISDFMRPERVVLGIDSPKARQVLDTLYRPLHLIETPILHTDIETAELAKYAANGFLAVKIGFINQIADLCEQTGANVQDVARAMGLDGRIGCKFLHAGPGFGGSCFPKDTRALSQTAINAGTPISIVDAVITSNEERKIKCAQKIISRLCTGRDGSTQAPTVAVLGITFKPNTDDLREAPAMTIIPLLQQAGLNVRIYDPLYFHGSGREEGIFPQDTLWTKTPYEAMEGADAAVILTEWNVFRGLDLKHMAAALKQPLLFDFRNIYRAEEMEGFEYHSIGRPVPAASRGQ